MRILRSRTSGFLFRSRHNGQGKILSFLVMAPSVMPQHFTPLHYTDQSGVSHDAKMNPRGASDARSAGALMGRFDAIPDRTTTRELSLEDIRTPQPPPPHGMKPIRSHVPKSRPKAGPQQWTFTPVSSFSQNDPTRHKANAPVFGLRPSGKRVVGLPGLWTGDTVISATGLVGYATKEEDVFGSPNATVRVHKPWGDGFEMSDWVERPGYGQPPEYLSRIASLSGTMTGASIVDGFGAHSGAASDFGASRPTTAPVPQDSRYDSRPSTAASTFVRPLMAMSIETIRQTEHPIHWRKLIRRSNR